MSILGRLFGQAQPSSVEALPDRVWISKEAKLRAIARELVERSEAGAAAMALVAHFPDVLAELQAVVAQYRGKAPVRALLARELSADAARALPLGETVTLELIVGERHPLPARDDELMGFAEALPCRCRIVHHISLDDALMEQFGAERLRGIMASLGASEDEPIAHGMVDKSIRAAQKKIAGRATGDSDASSAAEWLAKNLGGG